MIEPSSERPLATPTLSALAVGLLVTVLVSFFAVGGPAQMMNAAWGMWFTELFVFFGIPVVALRLAGREPFRTTGLSGFSPRAMAVGFAVGVVNYVAWAAPLMLLATRVFPKQMVEAYDSSGLFVGRGPFELVALISAVTVAAPVCEELFFRGVLQSGFERWAGRARALVLTSIIFTLFHLDPVGLVARFELGLVFGLLALRTRSLWAGIGAHAANNLVSVALFMASGSGDGESEPELGVAVAMFAGGNVVLVALVLALRRFPSLLASPEPAEDTPQERPTLTAALVPWLVGGLAAVGLVVLLDSNGIALNYYDLKYPVRQPAADAGVAEKEAYERLQDLRVKARRGDMPIDEYFELRRLASDAAK